jgi:APA family basic amino acid/polyamine antiporter
MVIAACYAHGKAVIFYLIVFCVIMVVGMMPMRSQIK